MHTGIIYVQLKAFIKRLLFMLSILLLFEKVFFRF